MDCFNNSCPATGGKTESFGVQAMVNLAAVALGLSGDRLRELAEADKDGRVVVLPCRAGNELWNIGDSDVFYTLRVKGFSTYHGRVVVNADARAIRADDVDGFKVYKLEEVEEIFREAEKYDG